MNVNACLSLMMIACLAVGCADDKKTVADGAIADGAAGDISVIDAATTDSKMPAEDAKTSDTTTVDSAAADSAAADAKSSDAQPAGKGACKLVTDCPQYVVYHKEVKTSKDCYCILCPRSDISLNTTTHDLYKTQYNQHCVPHTKWRNFPCPIPGCIAPNPIKCVKGTCQGVKP